MNKGAADSVRRIGMMPALPKASSGPGSFISAPSAWHAVDVPNTCSTQGFNITGSRTCDHAPNTRKKG